MRSIFLMIAWKNLTRRIKITGPLFLCVFVSVFAIILVWSSYDTAKNGVELSKDRMRADIMVYPYETELSDVSMLYSGIAQSVYMDADITERLSNEYVEKIVSQFYLQTLPTQGCCTVTEEMRLVGVDWENDLTIHSYLRENAIDSLDMQEVILGSNIGIETESTMILNMPVHVVGILETTGTYLDDSIILSMEQLKQLAKVNFPDSYFGGKAPADLITCALVQLKEGVDPQKYIDSVEDVQARKVLISSTADALQNEIFVLFTLLAGAAVVILFLCVVTLFSQVQVLISHRYREIGYLRSIGICRMDVYKMFIFEIGIVVMGAAILASIGGLAAARSALVWVRQYMSLPLADWTGGFIAIHAGCGILLTMLISVLLVAIPLHKAAQMSPQEAMTRGEI